MTRDFDSPYLIQEEAARYLRVKSKRTLQRYVLQYQIPRKGPSGNCFHIDDLDAFMDDKRCFIHEAETGGIAAPYKPVKL